MNRLRTPICTSFVAQTEPSLGQFLIWPGVESIYRVVIAYPNGDYETVSEHDDAEDAVNARDHAKSAAADALIALGEIGRASA